jgi:two-component system, OmpR family, sensor histidine kinase MtrB
MSGPVAPPARLRRRIAVSFVLVAGLSAAALAVGSWLLVRQTRLADSVERSLAQARQNVAFARQNLPESPVPGDFAPLRDFYADAGFETLAVLEPEGSEPLASTATLRSVTLPDDLRALVARGQIAYERFDVDGEPDLVVGARVPGRPVDLFFFFPERGLEHDLRQLAAVLGLGWALAVLVAGVAGVLLARRTLGPVARASEAARSMAEGLLDTRLPVDTDDEFGAWAASFNEMAQALEAKVAALQEARERERRFTSDVAHELRTPLAALVTEASLLREQIDAMPPDARRPAELLVADVARLRRLVDDLMEVSRFDAGTERVRPETLDLGSLTEACVRSRGWSDRVEVDAGRVVVHSDRRRLERVVANLVGNAVEHGRRAVRVRVGRDGVGAFVEVGDEGAGIPPEHLPHLFDRFYKADASRSGPGSGLGLAIALENARALGGDIEVWSEPGRGARFTLRLPVTEPLPPGDRAVSPRVDDEAIRRTSEGGSE